MMELKDDLVKSVQESFLKLPAVAASLSNVSDSLNNSAKRIENVLKKHNLGIASWVKFTDRQWPESMSYYTEQVGFAKVSGKWCLAIKTVDGDYHHDDDVQVWSFNEAPRGLRVKAVEKLPELLDQLVKDGNEMIQEVATQVEAVDFLAAALEAALEDSAENRPTEPSSAFDVRATKKAKPEGKK
jgi:hypothetical protein